MKKKINKQYTQISIYVIVTCIIIYILSLIAKNAPVIFQVVIGKIGQVITIVKPVLIGFVFAYLLNGVVDFLEEKLKKIKPFHKMKSTRGLAVLLSLFLVVLFLAFLISLLIFSITDQIKLANFDDMITVFNRYTDSINDFVVMVTDKLNSLNIESKEMKEVVNSISSYMMNFASGIVSSAAGSVSSVTGFFTTFFFAVIIAVYFLIDGQMVKGNIKKISRALFSDRFNDRAKTFIDDANSVFSGYMKGQLMDVVVMMFLISITLSIIGIKFAVIIGIIAGIGNLIPYCGPFIAYGASALVCLINGEFQKMIIAIIALVVVQFIDANIIGPKLLSHSIQIHPLLVIISLIIGSSIGGLFGMLLAVPVGALIKVIFMRYIENRIAYKEALQKLKEPENQVKK